MPNEPHELARLIAQRDEAQARIDKLTKSTFKKGDIVRHVKTGKRYIISVSARYAKLEATCEPVYVYHSNTVSDRSDTVWVRPKSEMEDGRFVHDTTMES